MRGVNDDEARAAAAVGARRGLPAAVHRADAAGRPARLGPRHDGHRRGDPRPACRPSSTLTPVGRGRAGQRTRPRSGSSTAAPAGSASSPRSPGRSAARATGSGSPPTDSCATACSPGRSPTCAGRCGPAPRTRSSAPGCGRRCWPSCRVTASTTRASCSRPGRCPPSAADRQRRLRSARRRATRRIGTVWRRNPRVSRKPVRCSRCVVARRPGLAPLRRVQLGVVPGEDPGRGRLAALGRADRRGGLGAHRGCSTELRGEGRCRAATGGAARHRARCADPGRPPAATTARRSGRVLHESVSRQPWVPSMARRSLREVGVRQSARSAPGRRWRTRPTRRGAASARKISTQRSQPWVSTASDEADRPDAHREQVAPGPGVDVVANPPAGTRDLVDRCALDLAAGLPGRRITPSQ